MKLLVMTQTKGRVMSQLPQFPQDPLTAAQGWIKPHVPPEGGGPRQSSSANEDSWPYEKFSPEM